jgi:hypothetical protein
LLAHSSGALQTNQGSPNAKKTFGGTAVTSVTVNSSTQVTAVSPVGSAGAQDVVLTTADRSGTSTGGFTYIAPSTISSVTFDYCDPTTTATITGQNLTGTFRVTLTGAVTTVTPNSPTCIVATIPGTVTTPGEVVLTNNIGSVTYTTP